MSAKLFLFFSVGLICGAIVIGLAMVGGPFQARRDKFDLNRYDDLANIARALICEKKKVETPAPLPEKLILESLNCEGSRVRAQILTDNETSEPYVYVRKSDTEFSVCAKFYDADRAKRFRSRYYSLTTMAFDPASGCLAGRRTGSNK